MNHSLLILSVWFMNFAISSLTKYKKILPGLYKTFYTLQRFCYILDFVYISLGPRALDT